LQFPCQKRNPQTIKQIKYIPPFVSLLELIVSQKKQLQQGVVVDAVRGEVQGVREHMTSTTNHRGNLKEGIRIGFQRKKHLS